MHIIIIDLNHTSFYIYKTTLLTVPEHRLKGIEQHGTNKKVTKDEKFLFIIPINNSNIVCK